MITVTHFSSLDLKNATQILEKHAPPKPLSEDTATAAGPEAAIVTPAEGSDAEKTSPADGSAVESTEAPEEAPVPAEAAESRKDELAAEQAAVSAANAAVLVEHMGIKETRATRLIDALSLVSKQLDRVSKVTVVQPEGAPAKAIAVGEFAYVVDMLPSAGGRGGKNKNRGSKPGGRGGKPSGPRRPGEGGKKPAVEDLRAAFSMDVAVAERKDAERARKKTGGPGGRGGRRGGRGSGGSGGRPSGSKA